ncbi:hypothetical protein AXF42_Ash014911 [Apostasia shenzhenica]|uniref:M-phase phosphoprotein 6 n=1 Tax=Apostasia shenzhenica TaxID=1088818 RepID=A0A2I0ALG7_9ASPA|nr:hypothetical protein AXF42_Ash014911 [Apostasia shenzhenica]
MAKRELSSTLRNLKFMQRASLREEKDIEEKKNPESDGSFVAVGAATAARRRCIVIMEGDPHPGALKGRMSFQSFNPSIDKLNEEAISIHEAPESSMNTGNGTVFIRPPENLAQSEISSKENNSEADIKGKQPMLEMEEVLPSKLQTSGTENANGRSSPRSPGQLTKRQKREKLDWSLLRRPKAKKKRT